MTFTLTTHIIMNHHFTRTADDNQLAFVVGHITHLARETCRTVRFRLYLGRCCCSRCRTTNVEGTHGQLCTRLTNRLGCNHADSFTGVNHFTARQVTAVTFRTQAITGFTCNWCAYFHLIDTWVVDFVNQSLGQDGARLYQSGVGDRIHHVFSSHTAQNTVAQWLNHVTALYHGFHYEAVSRAAIVFNHHQVLGHVYQTTGQVTWVRCFQRRIGQTFTRTVSGNKVL